MTRPTRATAAPLAWWIVVPVKAGAGAKSRLGALPGIDRAELASALSLDVIAAAVGAVGGDRVVVVHLVRVSGRRGRAVGSPVPAGPSGRARRGRLRRRLVCRRPGRRRGGGPARRRRCGNRRGPRRALAVAAVTPRALVPDHEGTGTALITAILPARMRPAFGPGSARRHEDAGHTLLPLELPRLRTDVDDADSLAAAVALGVGPHTRAVLGPPARLGTVQATRTISGHRGFRQRRPRRRSRPRLRVTSPRRQRATAGPAGPASEHRTRRRRSPADVDPGHRAHRAGLTA